MAPFSHQTTRLSAGRHESPDDGVCVMELSSILAGEPFSDAPRCVSPAIASALRGYNDGLGDGRRQTLKRFAAEAVGTASGRTAERHRRAGIGMAVATPGRGPLTALRRKVIAAEPYQPLRAMGIRVEADGDDELHARMLGLFDALIAMGRRADARPERVAAPEAPVRGCSR